MDKKAHGVFYTRKSPFARAPFRTWLSAIPDLPARVFVEPFAGQNAIPAMLSDLPNAWVCQDINPGSPNLRADITVKRGDSLCRYPRSPQGSIAITNPPYLGKSIAVRMGWSFPNEPGDDLYKICLRHVLRHHAHAAAILPASFLTADLHDDRIVAIDLLTGAYFDDTHHPTCLALFGSPAQRDWHIYRDGVPVGTIGAFRAQRDAIIGVRTRGVKFNVREGQIGLVAYDSPRNGVIRFGPAELVRDEDIKVSSRYVSRILVPGAVCVPRLIEDANQVLNAFRTATCDAFLTPYRGLRDDGDFRRRLDFKQAAAILSRAVEKQKEHADAHSDRDA